MGRISKMCTDGKRWEGRRGKIDITLLRIGMTLLKIDMTLLKIDMTLLKIDITLLKIDITLLKASERSECNTHSVNSGYIHEGRTNRRQGKAEAVVSLEVGELRIRVASDIQPNAKRLLVPIVGHVQDGEVACMRKRRLR